MAIFNDIRPAAETVSAAVIAGGFLPAALEVMDTMALKAVNDAYKMGIPAGAGAVLIIEVDGVDDGLDDLLVEIVNIAKEKRAIEVRPAKTPEEQVKVWAARKNAFGRHGSVSPRPITSRRHGGAARKLPRHHGQRDVKRKGSREEVNLPIAECLSCRRREPAPDCAFRVRRIPTRAREADKAVEEVMRLSIGYGGVISGEHGIGIEKKQEFMPFMFNDDDLRRDGRGACRLSIRFRSS